MDARQRRLCLADPAFQEALRKRVVSAERFSAFLDSAAFYVALDRPCAKCGDYRKRTRDRSCYGCHLCRSEENFERMKAGLAPIVGRSRDGHLDVLSRKRAERNGEHLLREFGDVTAKLWPMGKLEITFPNGFHDPDINQRSFHEIMNALERFPALRDALRWAGWSVD